MSFNLKNFGLLVFRTLWLVPAKTSYCYGFQNGAIFNFAIPFMFISQHSSVKFSFHKWFHHHYKVRLSIAFLPKYVPLVSRRSLCGLFLWVDSQRRHPFYLPFAVMKEGNATQRGWGKSESSQAQFSKEPRSLAAIVIAVLCCTQQKCQWKREGSVQMHHRSRKNSSQQVLRNKKRCVSLRRFETQRLAVVLWNS